MCMLHNDLREKLDGFHNENELPLDNLSLQSETQ